jgi:hypothetical protein
MKKNISQIKEQSLIYTTKMDIEMLLSHMTTVYMPDKK